VSDPTLMRAFLDAVSPPGSLWRPVPGGDEDHLWDGFGDGLQEVKDFLSALAYTRDPWRTPYLDELERDFGIMPNTQLTDAQRRATLALAKYARRRPSTISSLQDALDRAGLGPGGYGLNVYANDPAVDPGPFTQYAFVAECGWDTARCGYIPAGGSAITAICGINGGLWVVNGDVFIPTPNYLSCGDTAMRCGYIPAGGSSIMAECGIYYTLTYQPIIIPSPTDPWTWPACFFIAKGVTLWSGVRMPVATGSAMKNWYSICSDPQGNLWAVAQNGDIYKCPAGSTIFTAVGGTSRTWTCICSDPQGNLWAGVWNGDIYKCPAGSTTFTAVGGTNLFWQAICSDPSGNIWAVTQTNGDIYKCPAGSTTFTAVGGTSRTYYSICSDPSGNIWAVVGGGDIYKCPSGSTTFTGVGGTSRAWRSICSDPQGNLWATVYNGDIYKCPAGSTTFTAVGGTSRYWGRICSDPSGNIWAVVGGGDIYKCPSGSTTFTGVGGTSRAWSSICSDFSGNIWITVQNGDIYQGKYQANMIIALASGAIPQNMRQTLIEIILRWKPIHTWCALMCTFN
jgi:streptogramin lyase